MMRIAIVSLMERVKRPARLKKRTPKTGELVYIIRSTLVQTQILVIDSNVCMYSVMDEQVSIQVVNVAQYTVHSTQYTVHSAL